MERLFAADPGATPPVRTTLLGFLGSVLLVIGGVGAAAGPARDPILGHGPLSWLKYGHGRELAGLVVYAGFILVVWAWTRLGRHILAGRVRTTRPVLIAAVSWIAPLVIAPALFTRDVYSYLVQGQIAVLGLDPYKLGPSALTSPDLVDMVNSVHPFWQGTPAPYGPLFVLLAKGIVAVTGTNLIAGVIAMRVVLMAGLVLLLWALPGLVRHLGGSLPVAVWLLIAGPLTVVHLVGGPHNDLLMIGFLAAGTLCVLDRRHVLGVVLVTLGVAVKATAVVALPFLVWVWAAHLPYGRRRNVATAIAAAVAVSAVTFGALTLLAGVDLGWIGTLNASSRLVNWLSIPTAVGEILHAAVAMVVDVNADYFITVTRILGMLALVVVLVRQWWLARDGGVDAVRRAAIALFALAVLSPAMLPWYLTWSLAIAACLAWQRRQLALMVVVGAFMAAPYSPDGETLLYNWPFQACAIALSIFAGWSLLRPEPAAAAPQPDLATPELPAAPPPELAPQPHA